VDVVDGISGPGREEATRVESLVDRRTGPEVKDP
jgi:hypothetical protein